MKIAVLGVQRKDDKLWFADRDFDEVRRDFERRFLGEGGSGAVEVVPIEKQDERTGAVDESAMALRFAQEHKRGQIDAVVAESLVDLRHLQDNAHSPRAIAAMPALVFGTPAMDYDRRVPQPRPQDSVFRQAAMFTDYDAMVRGAQAALAQLKKTPATPLYDGAVTYGRSKGAEIE